MNSHNTKPTYSFHKTPVITDSGNDEAEVVSTSLVRNVDLKIVDEEISGCDPYNSTGQHVVIKSKLQTGD